MKTVQEPDHLQMMGIRRIAIPKSMQPEVSTMQDKLTRAIQQHQAEVGKLRKDPNNLAIHGQLRNIQLYIHSLGKSQKQLLKRLRATVRGSKTDNANGSKVSITSLLNLNNNNHIMNNNETKHETAVNDVETKHESAAHDVETKEHYEETVRNGDVSSPTQYNDCAKQGPSSVETVSGEDEVVEVPKNENSKEKKEEPQKEHNDVSQILQERFLQSLGLITKSRAMELQNKRAERKRRSTANPQFVYSMTEQPAKRQKRHSYLQGNAPHTRQTARKNGPSPPPNKAQTTKSTSPPARTSTKSLIPVQKSTTRPNILRNAESKVFVNKSKEDNEAGTSASSAKAIQPTCSKTVHIEGLPSSLTIERIENDSITCISCKNSGMLTICEKCSSYYHITCHTQSPAPPETCPKCAFLINEGGNVQQTAESEEQMEENKRPHCKKSDKFVATTFAPGTIGKTREDTEIYKTTGGLYKVDAAEKKHFLLTGFGVNQLPASTFLIPIASNADQPRDDKFSSIIGIDQRQDVSRNTVVLGQHQRSNVTYVQTDDQVPYSYQLSGTSIQSEKHQSYLIVKKVAEPTRRFNQSIVEQDDDQSHSTLVNYQLPTTTSSSSSLEAGVVVTHSLLFGRNNRKKQARTRAIPPLHRIISSEKLLPTKSGQLDRATFNGRKPWAKLSRGKLCINKQSVNKSIAEILWHSYGDAECNDNQLQVATSVGGSSEETASIDNRNGRHKQARSSTIIHSLFPGNNRPHILADRPRESRGFGSNHRDYPLLRQQLRNSEHEQLESREQSDKPATIHLQRRALTRFFEHVKLEEAHIPAPFRTKLVYKNEVALERGELDISENPVQEGACSQRHNDGIDDTAEAPMLTPPSFNSDEDSLKDGGTRRKRWTASDADKMTSEEINSNAANWSLLCHPSSVSSYAPSDYELTRANVQSSELILQSAIREDDQPDGTYYTREQKDDGALQIAQSNLSELRNEVSVPDDKADTERQDLSSGGRRSSSGNSSSNSSSGSSESSSSCSSSSHSDTPEQAMNGLSPSHISEDMYELLNINPVFLNEREELVRYVSRVTAMHEGDDSDAATG